VAAAGGRPQPSSLAVRAALESMRDLWAVLWCGISSISRSPGRTLIPFVSDGPSDPYALQASSSNLSAHMQPLVAAIACEWVIHPVAHVIGALCAP
jgi:hypothetical protein